MIIDKNNKQRTILFVVVFLLTFSFIFVFLPKLFSTHYVIQNKASAISNIKKEEFIPTYVKTPDKVRGIYMTSWVAGEKKLRDSLIKIIDDTELNTVVIDIKDYSGKIVFPIESNELKKFKSEEVRIPDLKSFIEELHKKNIYVIGRVAVFQDAHFVDMRPDLAVKTKDGLSIWRDRKNLSWIDPGSREYWDYIISIAKESRNIGFDEINFDYIRFPSDGNMQDIGYPFSSTTPRTLVLKNFFEYLDKNLNDIEGLKTSADLFGMTTTVYDDMGIGQILENALPYFDYVMPMVYPSHYPKGFEGFDDPEKYPYEVIKITMKSAVDRRNLLASSTTLSLGELRPWLQDFGLRVTYGSKEVRDQIQATNDLGIDSWVLWSPSNRYNKGALQN